MKKEYPGSKSSPKRTSKPDTKSGPRKESGGDFSPKTGAKRSTGKPTDPRGFAGDTKPGAKKEKGGTFSPTIGTKRAAPAPPVSRNPKSDVKPERGATQAFPPKRYINVYLSLGSNMGDRLANLRAAALLIDKNVGKIARKSHVYETEPWGETKQDAFLNQVIMANTTMDPRDLLEVITEIERELGREKKEKWGPRTIDIDILLYGKRVIHDKGLEIPHEEMHKRMFVLVPLMEIAPELEHPVLKQPIDELYMACKDTSEVVRLD